VIGGAFGAPRLLANTESDLVPRSGARACKNRKFIELKSSSYFSTFFSWHSGASKVYVPRVLSAASDLNRKIGWWESALPVCVSRRRRQFRLDKIWFEPEDGR